MWIWTLKHTKSWELALYSILLPVCWAENNWGFPTVRIFPDSTVYVSARDGETWVWVLGKSRWPWHVSLIFRRCKLCRRNRVPHHAAESVHACVLCGCILVYGQSHTRGLCSDGDAESTVRGDDSYEQCLFAPPIPPLLISGRPIGRRVPGPSQPSFPHGKYLTLTVAHVCHITHRSRRKIKALYVWWMMELYNRSLMGEKIYSSVVH